MFQTELWSLHTSLALFIAAGVVIAVCGVMVTGRAEHLARETRMGQAIMGAVFLGAMTSLSGLITSLTAAFEGHPELSVSNAVGGIAVQTTFLALADILYRRANLEHAAASEANLVQGALLILLLGIPLLGMFAPDRTVFGIHPLSALLVAAYLFGLHLITGAHHDPMWRPRPTPQTQSEQQQERRRRHTRLLVQWLVFLMLAALVAGAGWLIARAGLSIAAHTGLTEGVVGTLFTAITTSLPECVIAVAAVRRGALTLAVGDIIGGNTFDVLFLAFSDLVYRGGSIYHAVTSVQAFWLALSLLMAAVLLLGLIRREEHGIGNIGFESSLVLVMYLGGVLLLVLG
ncbi:MAG: sodium:calcium antiporter [Gammaproteobacteria bacterium]|jgi:cation:H+ antiporter